MATVNGTGSSLPVLPVQRAEHQTEKPVVQEAKTDAHEISDLAKRPGMLSLMMEKQSLRSETTQATSAAPKRNHDETITDSPAKRVKLSVASEGDANIEKPVVQEAKTDALETLDLAKQPGPLSLMMEKQNLRSETTQATSSAPKRKNDETITDSPAKMVKLSVVSEADANKAERLAGAVPGVLTSQLNITQPNNKPTERSKTDGESTISSTSSSGGQPRSQPVVAGGGTDITRPAFVNVVGPLNQVEVMNTLSTVLLQSERDSLLAAAKASERGMQSAAKAGDKGIAAAQSNLTGAWAAGAMAISVQGATTYKQTKAYSNENASINTNLKSALTLEKGVKEHANRVASSANPLAGNPKLSREIKSTAEQHQASDMARAEQLRNSHSQVSLETQKSRTVTDFANQAIHSGQNITQAAFGITAAEQQKEAELARASREVNNELASTHNQVGKKTAETNAAMRNMTDSILNANNSAASSIAERTR